MNIAILGCGYVGTAAAQHWQAAGHHVTATTTSPERVPELEAIAQRVEVIQGNNPEDLKRLFTGTRYPGDECGQ